MPMAVLRQLALFSVLLFSVYAVPVFAQYGEIPAVPEMDEETQDNKYCNETAGAYIGRQYVTDKSIIVKHQSLPDEMKVTPEELKLFKNIIRVVRDGDAITMDFNYDRLTIQLDKYDFIVKAYCG